MGCDIKVLINNYVDGKLQTQEQTLLKNTDEDIDINKAVELITQLPKTERTKLAALFRAARVQALKESDVEKHEFISNTTIGELQDKYPDLKEAFPELDINENHTIVACNQIQLNGSKYFGRVISPSGSDIFFVNGFYGAQDLFNYLDQRQKIKKAVDNVSFKVEEGHILGVLGKNGAGKSTIFRMILNILEPDEGEVLYNVDGEWNDVDIPGMGRMKIRSKLGFMHQEFALSHYATVLDQLATRLGYKNQNIVKEAQERARKIGLSEELLDSFYLLTDLPEIEARDRLKKIGLDSDILDDLFPKFPETATKEAVKDIFESLDLDMDILHRKSYELSGGQKVRVMLALILVSRPKFLLLDEPFGDLDPVTLRDVTNALKTISKDYGITIVMISHNTDFIKELSNRAVFMDDGKIIDDSEDIDKIVDNFIDFCHADYLKGE